MHFFRGSIYSILIRIKYLAYRLKTQCWYKLFLLECGKKSFIIRPIFFTPEFVIVKNNVQIWFHCRIQGVDLHMNADYSPRIIFDDHVSIQQNAHITCANRVEIGTNTAIAANVTITDINHPYEDVNVAPDAQPLEIKSVLIGPNCKIYNNVTILPGVQMGKHCIVGANSVVRSGNYPDFSVIAGNPAVVLKRYDNASNMWRKTNTDGSFI